ncbi:hypothetical protein JNB11_04930 [Kocuria palustris]|nr:hypothetical protein [Kocuria palustris]
MMAHTPNATPLRDSYNPHLGPQLKKLPMIVDIAIDPNGKQMYQVHELLKLVRKEMPRLTHFVPQAMEFGGDLGAPFGADDEKTPVRPAFCTMSPSLVPQKRTFEDDVYANPQAPMFTYQFDAPGGYSQLAPAAPMVSDYATSVPPDYLVATVPRSQDNDIWSPDVEAAFEEVLHLIPKNGLNKIKISGRLCGRNELILDYILLKTGKFRTRKQVLSHIQVIKNLGQKKDIIKLINEGPLFDTEEKLQENFKRFEEIFLKINLLKLLGFADDNAAAGAKRKAATATLSQLLAKRQRKASAGLRFDKVSMQNFSMLIGDAYGLNSVCLTALEPVHPLQEVPSLKLGDNVNVQARFPGLADFQGSNIHVLHNMVKVMFPSQLPYNYDIEQGFKSLFTLHDKLTPVTPVQLPTRSLPPALDGYSLFTAVYLYGNEVIKFNEEGIHLNEETPFLTKFWKFFVGKFMGKDEVKVQLAWKGMTIKQIVYEKDPYVEVHEVHNVPKSKIKMVLLWEFATVADPKDAVTTTNKLILPPRDVTLMATPAQAPQMNVQRKFQTLQQQHFAMPSMVAPPPQPQAMYSLPQYSLPQYAPPPPPLLHHSANVDLMMMPVPVDQNEFGGLLYPEGFQEY